MYQKNLKCLYFWQVTIPHLGMYPRRWILDFPKHFWMSVYMKSFPKSCETQVFFLLPKSQQHTAILQWNCLEQPKLWRTAMPVWRTSTWITEVWENARMFAELSQQKEPEHRSSQKTSQQIHSVNWLMWLSANLFEQEVLWQEVPPKYQRLHLKYMSYCLLFH